MYDSLKGNGHVMILGNLNYLDEITFTQSYFATNLGLQEVSGHMAVVRTTGTWSIKIYDEPQSSPPTRGWRFNASGYLKYSNVI